MYTCAYMDTCKGNISTVPVKPRDQEDVYTHRRRNPFTVTSTDVSYFPLRNFGSDSTTKSRKGTVDTCSSMSRINSEASNKHVFLKEKLFLERVV